MFILVSMAVLTPALALAAQPPDDDDDERVRPETEVVITARRLDVARETIEPSLGASTYSLTNDAVENRPGGETTNLGQILLQVPGVAQDGSGRLLVRGSRGAVQYRINNVIIPEGIADFGERLSTRLADRVQLITGALPAQYGLRVGGVVNIITKSGTYQEGGQAEIYGGSHGEIEPAFEWSGSAGPTSIFASGSYLRSNVGLSSPDGSAHPRHDGTSQIEGFAFADHVIDEDSRISLIFGTSNERFQIPNVRGLDALTYTAPGPFQRPLVVAGTGSFPSEQLDGDQSENSQYGILTYLRTGERMTVQASLFARYSAMASRPDELGSLLYAGISRSGSESDSATGLQLEGSYKLGETNTLRAGVIASSDWERSNVRSVVLPVNALGQQLTDQPVAYVRRSAEQRTQASAFLQDEWKPFDRVTVNFGLRLDNITGDGGGTRLSPRTSVVWAGPAGTTAHAGYARYFVPAPQEPGSVSTFAGTTGALPGTMATPIRPETDNYYDIGVQQTFGGLTLGLDGYWRDAQNLIDERPSGSPLVRQVFNYDQGRIRGLEFSLTYADGPFSAWGSLAIARGVARRIASNQFYFTPAELAHIDSHYIHLDSDQTYTASGGASYRLGPLKLSGDFTYGSGYRRTPPGAAPNSSHLPGHMQVDVAAVYRLKGLRDRPLDLRLDVMNLFDRRYEIRDGDGVGALLPQWGPRRGFFVGLEQAF